MRNARMPAQRTLSEWQGDFAVELREFSFDPKDPSAQEEFLKFKDRGFSAAFCYNDISALGLYAVIQRLKFRIPFDFSVIGFDDIFASQLATPPSPLSG
jgi:DNA-binding LacI/PurR family transcriptional regulator